MSGLTEITSYQAEALIICLAASVAWAGVLFFGARAAEGRRGSTTAEKLWIGALLLAVLPSLVAPWLAAFGVSLRPAPEPAVAETLSMVVADFAPRVAEASGPRVEPFDFDKAIGATAILYVYGVFLALFLWASKQFGLYYTVARARMVDDARFLSAIDGWADRLGVATPAIKRSPHVSSVCIFGVFRQTILIPQGIDARVPTDDLVLMCAHELAHVRRGDTRLFTATQLARVLFWFNPLVARIASRAELAAEESADALVLAAGVDRRSYAAVFVEGLKFAAYRSNAQPALAPSFTPADRHGRRRRLSSILSTEAPRPAPFASRLFLSAAGAAIALAAVGQAAFAVDPEAAGERRSGLKEMPVVGEITAAFGEKGAQKAGGSGPSHDGVDIKAPKGAKVFSPGDGVVVEATDLYNGNPAWGKVVVVDHGHGLVTRYAHLDSYRVKTGDRVRAGDVIATVGATGNVTGPHLHFETLRDGAAVDPTTLIADAPPAPDPVEAPEAWPAPAPAEAAEPVVAPAPVDAPEAAAFPDFKIVNPVVAARTPLFSDGGMHFTEPTGLVFADDALVDDVEKRLLGDADAENGAVYDLTIRSGDKVYRFSSDEPMTAERRRELREALAEMRREREEARREADRVRREHLAAQAEWRREAERARREMEESAADFEWSKEDQEELRKEFQLSRRELLEFQREAITDAQGDMETDWATDFDDAMADLDDAESDLEDQGLSKSELASARASLKEARDQLRRDRDVHKRAIENARANLEARRAEIDRQIAALD